jgi:Notch-like protein
MKNPGFAMWMRTLFATIAVVTGVGWPAHAEDLTIRSGPATAPQPSAETVTINGTVVPVPFPPSAPATVKRDGIRNALQSNGFAVTDNGPGGDACTVHGLPRPSIAALATAQTGTMREVLVASAVESGAIVFSGTFSPFGYNLQPAIFTAGIVTDVGELTAQVSAQELNFQTDGPIICQALFQRLAPHAPPYGAQINYAGDRLEVYFDPAYTVTQGGVVFGTTSTSPGCEGQLVVPVVEPRVTLTVVGATHTGPAQTVLAISATDYLIPVPPLTTADAKRDAIASVLESQGRIVTEGPQAGSMTIHRLSPSDSVTFHTGATGEASDRLVGAGVHAGRIGFAGTFDPLAYDALPAIFTAGIVTDVGELTAQVSASELNFQTEGPIICQALFQRLVPRAPQYGAEINCAGDRLEVYFDPAYTLTPGGVVFGTTSRSPGCYGTLVLPSCAGVNECSGNGTCVGPDLCACFSGWSGVDCSIPSCGGVSNCSGNGTCVAPNLCACFVGWSGVDCSIPSCGGVGNCSGNGTCVGPNQCACFSGWSGVDCSIPAASPAGRVPVSTPGVPLTVEKSGGDVALQWGASCLGSDTDYEVYEGTVGTYYSHQRRLCTTGGFLSATLTPMVGSGYYLVVPRNASREGSYGLNSGGGERPQGAPACTAAMIGACP